LFSKADKMSRSAPDGVIRFETDKDNEEMITSEINLRGVPWEAALNTYDLSASLDCMHKQITAWKIDVDAEFVLINSDNSKNLTQKVRNYADDEYRNTSVELDEWWFPINQEKGFVNEGKFAIEIRIWVYNMKGIRADPRIDFTDPNEPLHDIALVIGGDKIYANKGILASHSPVFKTMFYGNFAEK
ncbi:hypothetical protein PMAYCL1PPCAC_24811, partial [Pristionchus mayeri]